MEQKGDKRKCSAGICILSAEKLHENLRLIAEIIEPHVLIVRQLLNHSHYAHSACNSPWKLSTTPSTHTHTQI